MPLPRCEITNAHTTLSARQPKAALRTGSNRRHWLWKGCFMLAIGATIGSLCAQRAPLAQGVDDVERLREVIHCEDCHQEIAREWRASGHARAWTNPAYRAFIAENPASEETCSPCHAPKIILSAGLNATPELRDAARERGVDCIACHADRDFVMHGPFQTRAPHKTQKDKRYRSVQACLPCHGQGRWFNQVDDWRASRYARLGITCQTCHMPRIERPSVQHWALPDVPRRATRRHTFLGGHDRELVRSAASLQVQIDDGAALVTVVNSATGHALPGAGWRAVVLDVVVEDERGTTVLHRRHVFDLDVHDNRLKPGERRDFRYALPIETGLVKAKLMYKLFSEWPDDKGMIMATREIRFQAR